MSYDDELLYKRLRDYDNIWNKGFRWGCFTGFTISWVMIIILGLIS